MNNTCYTKIKYLNDIFQLPYYIDGDVKISQSHAILRHVARKYKLDGETEKEKAVVDMIIEEAMDLRNNIYKITYTSVENYVSGNIFITVSNY
jgi:glutathione S-transferase